LTVEGEAGDLSAPNATAETAEIESSAVATDTAINLFPRRTDLRRGDKMAFAGRSKLAPFI
jgi:hypothetical protein